MIRAENVRYSAGTFALHVTLDIPAAEYFVLLGATGSGKTLLMETLCGLRPVEAGRISLNDRDVTATAPRDRRIGYVPQDGALFTHLNVRNNIAFGIGARGVDRAERRARTERLARMLGIAHLLDRAIAGLSGGERQRVALARALACDPAVLLLDEPVSALDEHTRDTVCRELLRLQRETGVTVIHVCHVFEEAILMGDRIGILGQGRIVQTGTPDELIRQPANRYAAEIMRVDNIMHGTAAPEPHGVLLVGKAFAIHGPAMASGETDFLIRPWEIDIVRAGQANAVNTMAGRLTEFKLTGALARLRVDGPVQLKFTLPRQRATELELKEGQHLTVAFERSAVCPLVP
jgi:ABC-type Fe3+/spermidine/putrescine transport system ATPase subunit